MIPGICSVPLHIQECVQKGTNYGTTRNGQPFFCSCEVTVEFSMGSETYTTDNNSLSPKGSQTEVRKTTNCFLRGGVFVAQSLPVFLDYNCLIKPV